MGLFVHTRRLNVVAMLAISIGAALGWLTDPVGAQDLDPLADLVVLPGSCGPQLPMEPGLGVDCRFSIRPGVDASALANATLGIGAEHQWPCTTLDVALGGAPTERELLCTNVGAGVFVDGTWSADLAIAGSVAERAVEFATTLGRGSSAFLAMGKTEQVVFDGRPLSVPTFTFEAVDGVFLRIRERGSATIIKSTELVSAAPFVEAANDVVLDLPVGRYRAWPCVGIDRFTCQELPGGHPFQVISGEPLELVPGHNRATAERINILFVGSGLKGDAVVLDFPPLPVMARRLLGMGGPIALSWDQHEVDEGELADQLRYGPMAIEPLASAKDKFNFWYLADDLVDERALLTGAGDVRRHLGFDLPHMQITALYNRPVPDGSDARGTSFYGLELVPTVDRLSFGDARVVVWPSVYLTAAERLAHEWGHGLFELRDEYVGFDERPIGYGFPNCAPNEDVAQDWWGDQLGAVDPFAHIVEAERERLLIDPGIGIANLVERTTVRITTGGCYGDRASDAVFRPTADSLMHNEIPVFGLPNRERVESVLARFSGRGVMGSLDELSLECEGQDGLITCTGELETFLDEPRSTLSLAGVPCSFGDAPALPFGAIGPIPVTCLTAGPAGISLPLRFRNDESVVPVINRNLTPPSQGAAEPPPTELLGVPAPLAAPAPSTGVSARWIGAVAFAAIGAGSLLISRRRRRRTAKNTSTSG